MPKNLTQRIAGLSAIAALLGTSVGLAVSSSASAAWQYLGYNPSVVVCFDGQVSGPYGDVLKVQSVLVNNTAQPYLHQIGYQRPSGGNVIQGEYTVAPNQWGPRLYGSLSVVYGDNLALRWFPTQTVGNGGNFIYTPAQVRAFPRC